MQTQPWWGSPLVAGIFAFAGVMVAQVVVVTLDYFKVKREDARRWHAERRIIYAEALSIALKLAEMARTYNTGDDFDTSKWDGPYMDLTHKCGEIQLLGSSPVRKAILNVYGILIDCMNEINDNRLSTSNERDGEVGECLDTFAAAARKELGVKE
ncbi:hypothetical protein [Micromonospora chersina]|uniref:hypothetical protein n=1 Tax=Micromonospora chersina TaxID=47854 RepID=UPI001112D396|nr:hypothetical protein [Micromonospora chersina]